MFPCLILEKKFISANVGYETELCLIHSAESFPLGGAFVILAKNYTGDNIKLLQKLTNEIELAKKKLGMCE
jgi:hypothetical protein